MVHKYGLGQLPRVKEAELIWNSMMLPKHRMILWIASQNRILTKKRMEQTKHWPVDDLTCCLCEEDEIQTQTHLFARCGWISEIRIALSTWSGLYLQQKGVIQNLQWFQKEVAAAIYGAMIYHTWRARNMKIFRNINVNTSCVIAQIQREIRERIDMLHCSKRAHRCTNLVSRIYEIEEEEFGFSRNYFLAKELGSSSRKKSARKLSEIDLVDEEELREVAASIEPKHEKEVNELISSYKSLYSKWLFVLRSGFALLMYGFGSKKALIEDFASKSLTEYSVVVVNGYLQSINLKQVVITLAELLWDQVKLRQKTTSGSLCKSQQPFNTRSMSDLLTFLDSPDLEVEECFVCILVHNIDGPGLRDSDSQQCLASIAACSHVRMVASIDHVNAPLLWDKKMVHTQFDWYWCHVPTFAPYKVESMFFPFILAHGGSAQSVKTASIVLQSLTPNAQNVFKVLAEHQLAHPDEEGMPINNLYSTCRERFLVSSQVTLNSHLTEFKDHELIKTKRNSDGQDCLCIPLTNEALQKLIVDIV
ncbi:hypothetical protein KY284_028082 [Solanum tuberosum]|nr:hypothetical protein KY284_028082 [Solanum tuberosum]